MPAQGKNRDVIYSWTDESGIKHYSNYKASTEQPASPAVKPPPVASLTPGVTTTTLPAPLKTPKFEPPNTGFIWYGIVLALLVAIAANLKSSHGKRHRTRKKEPLFFMAITMPWWINVCVGLIFLIGAKVIEARPVQNQVETITRFPLITFAKFGAVFFFAAGIISGATKLIKKMIDAKRSTTSRPDNTQRPPSQPDAIKPEPENQKSAHKTQSDSLEDDLHIEFVDMPGKDTHHPSWSLKFIQSIEWREFEKLCARVLQAQGYRAELGDIGPDGGVDIHIYKQHDGPKELIGIAQCKAWRESIKETTVRDLRGAMASKEVDKGIFFTSRKFTYPAEQFCIKNKIDMITGADLLNTIKELTEDKQTEILNEIVCTDYMTPTCVNCKTKMRKKTNSKNNKNFWGCYNYPRCKNKIYI